jgi:putative flippase GtrA
MVVKHFLSKEFLKFCIIGAINTGLNLAVLFTLVDFFSMWYIYAAVVAFLVALSSSFILNTMWTFKQNIKYKVGRRYSKFFIVSCTAAFINIALLYIFTDFFRIYYMISQVMATMVTLMINFIGNKFWTYN